MHAHLVCKIRQDIFLKFIDGDGPNLCRVKKTFNENLFRSGLTLVSSNNIKTIKIGKKKKILNFKNHKKINKQKKDYFLKKLGTVKWR